jgi:NACalpha-BTF3-like transcription factor/uncharacterized membrane protein YciS (DUF1049 family)
MHGVDAETCFTDGMNALHYTARHGNLNTMSFFVMCGVDLNKKGALQYSNETALSLAKKSGQARTVQELKTLTSTTVTSLGVRWSAKKTPYAIPLFWLAKFYLVFSTFYFATKPHGVLPSYDWALLIISVTSLGSYHLARTPPGRVELDTKCRSGGEGGACMPEIVVTDSPLSQAVIVPRERRAGYCRYRKEWVRRHCHRSALLNQTIGLENHLIYTVWLLVETVFLLSVLLALAFAGGVFSLAFVLALVMLSTFYRDLKITRMQLRTGLTMNEMTREKQMGFEYCGKLRQHYYKVVTLGKGCGSQLGREIIEFLWRPLQTGLVLDEKLSIAQHEFEQASATAVSDQIACAKRAPVAIKAVSVPKASRASSDLVVELATPADEPSATQESHQEDGAEALLFSEDDVAMVVEQTGVMRERAMECLQASNGDLMDAILEASCG